jgi:hypothetical protein
MIIQQYQCDNCKEVTTDENEILGIHLESDPYKPINARHAFEMNNPNKCKVHCCVECYRLYVTVAAINKKRYSKDKEPDKSELAELGYLLRYKLVLAYNERLKPSERKGVQAGLFQ